MRFFYMVVLVGSASLYFFGCHAIPAEDSEASAKRLEDREIVPEVSSFPNGKATSTVSRREYYEKLKQTSPLYADYRASEAEDLALPASKGSKRMPTYGEGPLGGATGIGEEDRRWWEGEVRGSSGRESSDLLAEEAAHYASWPEYRIRAGDQLLIALPYVKETEKTVTVRPDGRINYIHDIEILAAGKTVSQLREEINAAISTYYRNPRVSITVQSFKGSSVFVMGEVKNPGRYEITIDTRLLDLLAQAEVLKNLPEPERDFQREVIEWYRVRVGAKTVDLAGAFLLREGRQLDIDFEALVRRGDLRHNILLRPNDLIYIPSTYRLSKKVYLCGAVRYPQIFYFEGNTSLLDCIMLCGGVKEDIAKQRDVWIIRKGVRDPIRVDYFKIASGERPNIPLIDRDIVYVPERELSRRSRELAQVAKEIILPLQVILDTNRKFQEAWREHYQWSVPGEARRDNQWNVGPPPPTDH